jgi:hypothetical protein
MKKFLIAALATTAFAATPAFAQTAQGEILVSANVAKACGVGDHLSGAAAAPGWDQSDISVVVGADSRIATQTFTNRSFGNVWCNGPATVTLAVGALRGGSATTDTSSFTNRFDISVVTDAGVYIGQGQDYNLTTIGDGSGDKAVSGAPNSGGAFETGLQRFGGADSITVHADPSNRRATAGSYSGYLRFTATAN